MTDTYNETLSAALNTIQEPEVVKDDGFIHLSSGVVLKPRKINPLVFQQVASQFKDPAVPYIWDEKKQRKEYNPMHPDYIDEKKQVEAERSMATIDAVIALGTMLSPEHPAPQDVTPLESDDWIYDLEAAGLVFDINNQRMRYRTWVKFIACPEVKDIELITSKVLKYLGVVEENVAASVDSFQHKT